MVFTGYSSRKIILHCVVSSRLTGDGTASLEDIHEHVEDWHPPKVVEAEYYRIVPEEAP
jgi:hypothetical protein